MAERRGPDGPVGATAAPRRVRASGAVVAEVPSRPGPGRPRDLARQDAVLGVTTELLAAGGYDALTISEVAARAGVGRQMIYRWWPTKRDLVASALFAHGSVVWPTVYRGPLADDLRVLITAL